MLRIVVRITDSGDACNIGGAVQQWTKTVDLDFLSLESLLRVDKAQKYRHAEVIGVEVLEPATPALEHG